LQKYRTIVIDPPWPGPGACPAFDEHSRLSPAANPRIRRDLIPYHTMTGVQCAALRIRELAAADGQVFIWAPSRNVGDAFLLLQLWAFRYRGLFVWIKPLGLGRHMRSQAEFLLWGGRRGAPLVRPRECPHQLQRWPKPRRHSEKPPEAYAMIAALGPAPRLDVFARRRHEGFDAFGDEIEWEV